MRRSEETGCVAMESYRPCTPPSERPLEMTPTGAATGNDVTLDRPPKGALYAFWSLLNYLQRRRAGDASKSPLARFGLWQLRALWMLAITKTPTAWQMAAILFTSPSPRAFWCRRPVNLSHWSVEEWLNYSRVDGDGDGDQCYTYREAYEMFGEEYPRDNATMVPCTEFEYDSTITTITQWNLVCKWNWLPNLSQSFYLLGILIGGMMCIPLATRFRPRRLWLAGALAQIASGTGVAMMPIYPLHMLLRTATAASCAHMFTSAYIICADNAEGKIKTIMGFACELFWSLGVITLPCIASFFTNWQYLQLALSLPSVVFLLMYRWTPESPVWLKKAGYTREAKAVLDEALRYNGGRLPPANRTTPPLKGDTSEIEATTIPTPFGHYVALFIAWSVIVPAYYGTLLNVKNIGDQVFIYTGIAAVAEVVGCLLSLMWALHSLRKWTVLGLFNIFCGALCFLVWILPQEKEVRSWTELAIAMVDRVAIAASLNMLTVVSGEFFPLSRRPVMMYVVIAVARFFLLFAPFIGYLATPFGDVASLSAFGGLTIIAGLAEIVMGRGGELASPLARFGPWQLRALWMLAITKTPSAWQMVAILFTGPPLRTFCCRRPNNLSHWSVERWLNYSSVERVGNFQKPETSGKVKKTRISRAETPPNRRRKNSFAAEIKTGIFKYNKFVYAD